MAESSKNGEITKEEWEKIEQVLERYKNKPGSLIPVLKDVQDVLGYVPIEVQRRIAEVLGTSPSQVYGVVTFYAFFTMVPRGKYTIRVCLGTACYVKGSEQIAKEIQRELNVEEGGTTEDRKFSFEVVRCLGACGLAPVMMVGEDTYGALTPAKALEILRKY